MIKRISVLLTLLILVISFAACNEKEPPHKTGWQNPDENATSNKEDKTEETTNGTDTANPVPDSDEVVFSESKAQKIGALDSKIYGTLNIYLQEGYFLLRNEYDETKFTVFANNYSYKETEDKAFPIFDDMNFDGHNDFAVCYAKDALNSYYYCFLWDNTAKNYSYYNPLSSLANPVFDSENSQIISNYKLTATKLREDIYIFNGSQLQLAFSEEKEIEQELDNGPEILDSELVVLENGNSALITLASKEETHSKWVCHIENESIITLSSEYFDENEYSYEFLLSAVSPGSTTVIFRFETVGAQEYVEERIINIIVSADGNVEVIIPEEDITETTPVETE